MALELYGHPFSSYTWKALIALYENDTPFTFRELGRGGETDAAFAAISPLGKFPVLIDGDRVVCEATVIIDYLDVVYPGPGRLLPDDRLAAVEVRMLDRLFDNYVMAPVQTIVGDAMRATDSRDAHGVAAARRLLDRSYAWHDARMAGREWASDAFSLADCAAAPALFYADWVHPIGDRYPALAAYRARLLARPSARRCVEDARPFRALFPLGAPDRD